MTDLRLNNVDDVVSNGYCIGCMACMGMCPKGDIDIKDGDKGFPVPIKHEDCDNCGRCIQECPTQQSNEDG